MPYFTGVCKTDKGVDTLLKCLELPFGISATEETAGNFQWGYKNGWACLQLIATEALEKIGRIQDAKRIAEKYVRLVEDVFNTNGKLWEKYNVIDGNANAVGEYGTPEMLGWTAGVYMALKKNLQLQNT